MSTMYNRYSLQCRNCNKLVQCTKTENVKRHVMLCYGILRIRCSVASCDFTSWYKDTKHFSDSHKPVQLFSKEVENEKVQAVFDPNDVICTSVTRAELQSSIYNNRSCAGATNQKRKRAKTGEKIGSDEHSACKKRNTEKKREVIVISDDDEDDETPTICGLCKTPDDGFRLMIPCDGTCDQWFHNACAEFHSFVAMQSITFHERKWYCTKCNPEASGDEKQEDNNQEGEVAECVYCKEWKTEDEFNLYEWSNPPRTCNECTRPCLNCKELGGTRNFSEAEWANKNVQAGKTRKCLECVAGANARVAATLAVTDPPKRIENRAIVDRPKQPETEKPVKHNLNNTVPIFDESLVIQFNQNKRTSQSIGGFGPRRLCIV